MYHFEAGLATVVLGLIFHHVDTEPVATPAPISPAHGILVRDSDILGRDAYLSYCYGTGNYCSLSQDLYNHCNKYLNLRDQTQWFVCLWKWLRSDWSSVSPIFSWALDIRT
jgi:hypothetical protein